MFVFGVVKSSSPSFDQVALPSIERWAGRDCVVLVRQDVTSISEGYNSILEQVSSEFSGAEGVVLMHQDIELIGPGFLESLRTHFADPSIGLVGVIGASGVRSLVYWRAQVAGYVRESQRTIDFGRASQDVDAVDGMLLALAPDAFKRARFDENLCTGFHGYDIDLAFTIRAMGLRVVVSPLPVVHHTKGGYGDRLTFLKTSRAWRRKWLADAPVQTRLAGLLDELHVASRRDNLLPMLRGLRGPKR